MRRATLLLALALCITACEVSVFGSDPIVIIGEHSAGGTEWAHSCEEPEASREARAAVASGSADGETGCTLRCVLSGEGAGECDAAEAMLDEAGAARPGLVQLDLHDHEGVILTVEVCDPTGTVLQLGDSPTNAAGGGDAGSSSHDTDMVLVGTTLSIRPATAAETPASAVEGFVAETGCTTRTLVISEMLVYLVEPDVGLCGPGMFRIDPPTDAEGSPDARWYLSTAGSLDGTATGSGLRRIDACFW
jgi:hypothetical protein